MVAPIPEKRMTGTGFDMVRDLPYVHLSSRYQDELDAMDEMLDFSFGAMTISDDGFGDTTLARGLNELDDLEFF